MNGALILLVVVVTPYFAVNLRPAVPGAVVGVRRLHARQGVGAARARQAHRAPRDESGMNPPMSDDDDWVGTPPEGHHSRDRAKPDFWRSQWQVPAIGGGVLMVLVLLVVLLAA